MSRPDPKSPELESADAAFEVMRHSRAMTQVVDYDDMLWVPYVDKLPVPQFDYVFLDETQDMNAAQLYLVLEAVKAGGRVIAVGDPRQAIYGFRGADSGAMDNITQALAITDAVTLAANLPVANVDVQNFLTLSFVRPEPAPADAEYQLWASDDLTTWNQVANPATSITPNGATGTVVLKDSAPLAGKSKRFLKLVVVQKP